MAGINQKEYLKKYLSKGSDENKKKKRKKKQVVTPNRVKIIDDDIDVNLFNQAVEEDLYGANEDAPQIVGVVDERPLELRIDDYRDSDKWKPLGSTDQSNLIRPDKNDVKTEKNDVSKVERPDKKRFRKDSDNSPIRSRKTSDDDLSPVRVKSEVDSDISPPRRGRDSDDLSPRRDRKLSPRRDRKVSPRRDSKLSPRRDRKISPRRDRRISPRRSREIKSESGETTLDGKKSGLQSSKEALKELENLKRKDDDGFRKLSDDISGAAAKTVFRDRKTGKIRDFEKEAEAERKKKEKEEERAEKYTRWGRGLKQVEDYTNKLNEDLHEMNKPLARYADDEDLEKYLKEQERVGDPMLAYIRKKKKKENTENNKPVKPQYEGEFMPNRYGIRPGHRWDGVDRSNGYEMKWIQRINAQSAQQEDVYKWSTEDM